MRKGVLLLAAALCLLSGCAAHAREPEGLELVRVLGVDGGDQITLTAVCGVQSGQEAVRGTAGAAEFCAARSLLPGCGERELALTNLSFIIINKEVDLQEVLMEILQDREMSPSATVWVTDSAGALLAAEKDPAGRLEVLSGQGVEAPTVTAALAELETAGVVRLPVLREEDGLLVPDGALLWEAVT